MGENRRSIRRTLCIESGSSGYVSTWRTYPQRWSLRRTRLSKSGEYLSRFALHTASLPSELAHLEFPSRYTIDQDVNAPLKFPTEYVPEPGIASSEFDAKPDGGSRQSSSGFCEWHWNYRRGAMGPLKIASVRETVVGSFVSLWARSPGSTVTAVRASSATFLILVVLLVSGGRQWVGDRGWRAATRIGPRTHSRSGSSAVGGRRRQTSTLGLLVLRPIHLSTPKSKSSYNSRSMFFSKVFQADSGHNWKRKLLAVGKSLVKSGLIRNWL